MIDLAKLAAQMANILGGVSILGVVVFAIVAYLKQWGVAGKWLTGSAFAVGIIVAVAVRLAMLPAYTFADWVWTVLFGLMAGLLATGAYKGVENATGADVIKKQAPLIEAAYQDYSKPTDDTAERA